MKTLQQSLYGELARLGLDGQAPEIQQTQYAREHRMLWRAIQFIAATRQMTHEQVREMLGNDELWRRQ
jgi:hypothetical protein